MKYRLYEIRCWRQFQIAWPQTPKKEILIILIQDLSTPRIFFRLVGRFSLIFCFTFFGPVILAGEGLSEEQSILVYQSCFEVWMKKPDNVIIGFLHPTPQGFVGFMNSVPTSSADTFIYDMEKLTDFNEISYFGSLHLWTKFLKLDSVISDRLKNVLISIKENKFLKIDAGPCSIDFPSSLLPITSNLQIALDYDIFTEKQKPVWGLRRILISERSRNNYVVYFKSLRPHKDLSDDYHDSWKSSLKAEHPFTEEPYRGDEKTEIAGLILSDRANPESITQGLEIYYVREGEVKDKEMKSKLRKIKAAISIFR